jgi:methyl-accepting chemotaxis protein
MLRNDWTGQLRAAGSQLYALAATTEKEFLSVGSSLNDFHVRASEISRMCSSLLSSMADEEIGGISREFRELLHGLETYLAQTEREFNEGIAVLQNILNIVSKIYKPISGFKKIVKTLKILGISTKIESSQLSRDNNGFITIADDVEKLSVLINSRFADILKAAETLRGGVQQTLSSVLSLESKQEGKVRSILDGAQSTLLSLSEKNESSVVTAGRISEELETITKSIGEVVSSLQFHDITRQQIEHVNEALEGLCSTVSNTRVSPELLPSQDNHDSEKIIMDTYAVCELQKAQLVDSEQKLLDAVSSIMDNLKNIALNITGIHHDVQHMAGIEGEMSSSFFSKLEDSVSSAISSLQETKDATRELSSTMRSLTSAVTDMSRFMYDIEEIGSEIELIAVNALIKSAHTGTEGAPLGIIAEAIRKLSTDARLQKVAVSDELQSIVLAAEGLGQNVCAHTEEQTTETDKMLQDFNLLLQRLERTNNTVISLLGRIQNEGQTLASDIEEVLSGMTVHETFPKGTENAKALLSSIIAESVELLPDAHKGDRLGLLKHLENNYTMQSERRIHGSILSHQSPGKETRAKESEKSEDHFGNNIELF